MPDTGFYIDVQGDNVDDFFLRPASADDPGLSITPTVSPRDLETSIFSLFVADIPRTGAAGAIIPYAFEPGSSWDGTVDNQNTAFAGTNYIGILFYPPWGVVQTDLYFGYAGALNGAPYHGWLHFYFPSSSSLEGALLVGGAYETDPGTPVIIGSVPEPSALILTLMATAGGLALRRRPGKA